ncbi:MULTISPECIES: ATP-binding protein [Streptomyces]|uniref:ATP-binding protein n=2 Tax=Streptomyces TaxID=1883 RepID=A0ABV9J7E3_9ACTN
MSSPAQFRSRESVRDSSTTAALHLRGSRKGFTEARDFTLRTLGGWSLGHCADDTATVVTELAANAVLHGLPYPSTEHFDVRLRLTLRRRHVMCAVTDPSDALPVYLRPGDDLLGDGLQEHGRGLHIVEALSEHWGWTRRSPVGKTVWAMLPTRTPC